MSSTSLADKLPKDPLLSDPAQLPRLWNRLHELDEPVIQILGWPGSGKRRLLAAFARRLANKAAFLPLDPAGLDPQTELDRLRAQGKHWLLCQSSDPRRWRPIAERLQPPERIILASSLFHAPREKGRTDDLEVPMGVISFSELLLQEEELAELAVQLNAKKEWRSEARLGELFDWSEGWLGPCELALRQHGPPVDLANLPGLEELVRYRVIEELTPEEAAELKRLCDLLATGPMGKEELLAAVDGSLERWDFWRFRRGWVLCSSEGEVRVPAVLLAVLARAPTVSVGGDRASGRRVPLETGSFRLDLLGPPKLSRVLGDGRTERLDWPFKRVIEVLALIATQNGLTCPKEQVLESIWPEAGAASQGSRSARSLHPTVSHLRKLLRHPRNALCGTLQLRQGSYTLEEPQRWRLDVRRFEEVASIADEASLDGLRQALALYRGPFMEGFHRPWIVDKRKQLAIGYRRLLKTVGDRWAAAGRQQESEDAYRRLLLEDPVQEQVHLSIMKLYASSGRPDLVRRQYQRLCEILQDQLQVRPMDTTAREYQRLIGWNR